MIELTHKVRRCTQCWQWREYPVSFIGRRGLPVNMCSGCREKYYGWSNRSVADRMADRMIRGIVEGDGYTAQLVIASRNSKVGNIPVSKTDRASCPDACSLKNHGCYAEYHLLGMHWSKVPKRGVPWAEFCADVAALPAGQLWRHNDAGDLPGRGDIIDGRAMKRLVDANEGRRGFTFTHKPVRAHASARANRAAIADANARGFAVNVSTDRIEDVDRVYDLGIGPVVTVVPSTQTKGLYTRKWRKVIVCPAQIREDVTCESCRLCAISTRKAVIAFRSHGQAKAFVDTVARRRLPVVSHREP